MTVVELMEKLKKCDPNASVYTYDNEYGCNDIIEDEHVRIEGSNVV